MATKIQDNSGSSNSIYVKGLAENTTDDAIRSTFARFGPIVNIQNNSHRGFAFIEYDNPASVQAAVGVPEVKLGGDALERQVRQSVRRQRAPRTTAASASESEGPVENSLYVGGLPFGAGDDELRALFGGYGNITDMQNVSRKGFAIIDYEIPASVQRVLSVPQLQLQGKTLTLEVRKKRTVGKRPARRRGHREVGASEAPRGASSPSKRAVAPSASAAAAAVPGATLYLGNVPADLSEETIMSIFSPFGRIQKVVNRSRKHFAFVQFESAEAVEAAVNAPPVQVGENVLTLEVRHGRRRVESEGAAGGASPSEAPRAARPKVHSLYVKNLPENTSEEALAAQFTPFGNVVKVHNQADRQFAFIDFDSAEALNRAMAAETKIGGNVLVKEIRRSRGKPRVRRNRRSAASGDEQ